MPQRKQRAQCAIGKQVCGASSVDVSVQYASAWLSTASRSPRFMLFKFSLRERSRSRGIRRVAVFVKEPVAAFLWKYRCGACARVEHQYDQDLELCTVNVAVSFG